MQYCCPVISFPLLPLDLFCLPQKHTHTITLLRFLHLIETIFPFVSHSLQLKKTPLYVCTELQPFIKAGFTKTSRVARQVRAPAADPTTCAGSPSHMLKERPDDHFCSKTCPFCRLLSFCPASMPWSPGWLLLPSVQVFCLQFPSIAPIFSIIFLASFVCLGWSPLLTQASWETLETGTLLLYALLGLCMGTCVYIYR